jgi:restriction endonuclease Mrr
MGLEMTYHYNIHERYAGSNRSWPIVGTSRKRLAKEILALLVARSPEQLEYSIVRVLKQDPIER